MTHESSGRHPEKHFDNGPYCNRAALLFAAGTLLGRFLPLAKRSALDETHSPDWPLHAICATAGNYFPAGLAKSEPASLGLFYRARIIPPDWKRSQKLAPKVCDMTFGDSCPFR